MCLAFQSNCFLTKCQISYRFVKDTRAVPLKYYYKDWQIQSRVQQTSNQNFSGQTLL